MSILSRNTLHVARREYLVRVRGRAFVITTGLLAIAVAAFILLPVVLAVTGGGDTAREGSELAVSDQAGDISSDPVPVFQVMLQGSASGPMPGMELPAPGASGPRPSVTSTDDPGAAAEAVRAGELDGLLTITRTADGELEFDYLAADEAGQSLRLLIMQAATAVAIADRLERAGIPPAESAELFAPPPLTVSSASPDDRNASDDEAFAGGFVVAYALVVFTFMAILTYGNWVAQSVAEEKSGRVMELLITAATPRELLTGKVLGAGAAGLTQYLFVVAVLLIGLLANGPLLQLLGGPADVSLQLPPLAPAVLAALVAFFLLGFLLYSTLYAAAGSMVSRQEDVQQAVGPLIFLAMAAYFVSFAALNDPAAGWVAALSLAPFFSPYLMPARMLLSAVPIGEVVAALLILTLALAGALWVAARIYRAGVLMYGQRASIRSILRATRVER